MTKFFICRHGETENNLAKRHQGWIDTPLTERGIQHALAIAEKLKNEHLDKIVSSDLGRAFTTAYIISRTLKYLDEIQRYAGLREVNYGKLANMPYEAHPHISNQEYGKFVNPEGESLQEMKERVLKSLEDISQNNPDKVVLIVAHDGTINAIRSQFQQVDIGIADQTRNAHDCAASFEYYKGTITSLREVSP